MNTVERRRMLQNRRVTHRKYKSMTTDRYSYRHSGTLLVVGGSKDALQELAAARTMRPNAMVMGIGHIVGMVRVDFIVSDHYEVHEELRSLQNKFGSTHYTTHCAMSTRRNSFPAVDYWWNWRRSEASSVQTGIRVGLAVGFQEIILCGCPLEAGTIQHPAQQAKDGFIWPPPRDITQFAMKPGLNTSGEILRSFREHFVDFSKHWKGLVFSMSGFTKNVLGEPPLSPDHTHHDVSRAIHQWTGERSLNLVYPKRQGKWPDRDAVDILKDLCEGRVCEVGCGTGRCCEAFDKNKYIGIDINPHAIKRARQMYPGYDFRVIDWYDSYPDADTYLFYTVLLHVPDREVLSVLSRTAFNGHPNKIVVFESMSRNYRNESRGNYQRNVDEYERMIKRLGRRVVNFRRLPSSASPGFRHFMVVQ